MRARHKIIRRLDIGFYVITAIVLGFTGFLAYYAYIEIDSVLAHSHGLEVFSHVIHYGSEKGVAVTILFRLSMLGPLWH